MKDLIVLILIGYAGYTGYQKYFSLDLYGKYELDVAAMQKQLEDGGVPQGVINEFRRQYGSRRIVSTITKQKISVEINGESIEYPYAITGNNENCTTLKIEGKLLDYCLENDILEVHTEDKPMFEVYKRI